MLLSQIFEARRNPELNPKKSIVEALRPYRNDKTMFISYVHDVGGDSHPQYMDVDVGGEAMKIAMPGKNTSGLKIGVNPRQEHHMTPAGIYTYPLPEIFADVADDAVPFGSTRPFVYLVRSVAPVVDLASVSKADVDDVRERLVPVLANVLDGVDGAPDPKAILDMWTRKTYAQSAGALLWVLVDNVAVLAARKRLGQDVLTSSHDGGATLPWVWNGLLRALGFKAFVDRKGEGIIFDYEPIQAVFLEKTAFEVIDVFANKR